MGSTFAEGSTVSWPNKATAWSSAHVRNKEELSRLVGEHDPSDMQHESAEAEGAKQAAMDVSTKDKPAPPDHTAEHVPTFASTEHPTSPRNPDQCQEPKRTIVSNPPELPKTTPGDQPQETNAPPPPPPPAPPLAATRPKRNIIPPKKYTQHAADCQNPGSCDGLCIRAKKEIIPDSPQRDFEESASSTDSDEPDDEAEDSDSGGALEPEEETETTPVEKANFGLIARILLNKTSSTLVKHSQLVEKLVAEFKHAKGELAKKKRDELLRLYASAAVKKKQVTVPSDWRQRALSVEEVVVRSSKAATLSKGKGKSESPAATTSQPKGTSTTQAAINTPISSEKQTIPREHREDRARSDFLQYLRGVAPSSSDGLAQRTLIRAYLEQKGLGYDKAPISYNNERNMAEVHVKELLVLEDIEVADEKKPEYETALDKWRAYASMLQHFPAEQLPAAPPQPRAHDMRLLRAKQVI